MKKKPDPWWKKFLIPILITVVIIPTATIAWNYLGSVFAAPAKIQTIEQAVVQNAQTQKDLTGLVQEQKEKNDQQDAEIEKQKGISQLQIDSLKGLLAAMKK